MKKSKDMHQLWQAIILKPFKLEEYILHFWKPPIFINLVSAGQGHTYILNTQKAYFNIASFLTVYLLGVNSQTHRTVYIIEGPLYRPEKLSSSLPLLSLQSFLAFLPLLHFQSFLPFVPMLPLLFFLPMVPFLSFLPFLLKSTFVPMSVCRLRIAQIQAYFCLYVSL